MSGRRPTTILAFAIGPRDDEMRMPYPMHTHSNDSGPSTEDVYLSGIK